jgi:hypothetical protein
VHAGAGGLQVGIPQRRRDPYAAALAKELSRQGLDHLNLFQNVKETVIASTRGSQQPWESNGLSRRVYLTGEPTMPAEIALWESVRLSNDIASLEKFIERFPSGVFAAIAAQMIERLKAEAVVEQERKDWEAKHLVELQKALEEARVAREAVAAAEARRLAIERKSTAEGGVGIRSPIRGTKRAPLQRLSPLPKPSALKQRRGWLPWRKPRQIGRKR